MDDLYPYYDKELRFFRQMSGEFAERFPKVAGRLKLDREPYDDPHVERLIEASALLAARVQKKIDDEFPEITESLLGLLYPHYLRPIPSLSIVQFAPDVGQSKVAGATKIDAGVVVHSRPAASDVCTFRSCYPVTLWPLQVTGAGMMSPGNAGVKLASNVTSVVRLEIGTLGGIPLSTLPLRSLRFYLHGDATTSHGLYELLLLNTVQIVVRSVPRQGVVQRFDLESGDLTPVGLGVDEGVLPYSDRSFLGYRLLQEYFHFPEKFLFVDLAGLAPVSRPEFENAFEILFCLDTARSQETANRVEQGLTQQSFQLGCTPIVNLFERVAEPVRLTHAVTEYRVVPDQHRQLTTEVYSIDKVTSTAAYSEEPRVYEPFYSFHHAYEDQANEQYWYGHRRPSSRKGDPGSEMYLSLVNLGFKGSLPTVEMLTVRVTCTNRDLPAALTWTGEWGELFAEDKTLLRVRTLRKPTPTVRPPARRGLQWRLISHLGLNHLSIIDGGLNALQEILRLYDFHEGDRSQVSRKHIQGIVNLETAGAVSRVQSDAGVSFCRGIDVTVRFR